MHCCKVEAPPLEKEKYAELYEVDEPIIKFEGGVNEIQHEGSMVEIAEEQAKIEVWSKVISWVERGQVLEKDKGKSSGSAGSLFIFLS